MERAASTATIPSALPQRQILVIFGGLILVMLLGALDGTIVATALPTIVGELGGLAQLSWVVTAYLLAQTVVTPLYGKLGDLYGRRSVLQIAIIVFLVGSVLCGLSGSMMQLILFRALQGLGGGGLIVTTQAVVGDIVPPRERGRYQGIFGAVFAVASIAGPLLGGYFTTHWSWRWIFYINLPVGLAALAVLVATLPARPTQERVQIDYPGAGFLAGALSAVILVTDLGGTIYPWTSPETLALIGTGIGCLVGFIWAEQRAPSPVLPLRLFRNKTFVVGALVSLIVGFALFGSVTYLPLYLQVVKGMSPTGSGLLMLPLMAGTLAASITSGQIISRTGRYKLFPVAGTALAALGLLLLSRMGPETSLLTVGLFMLVLGLGIGMVMQVLIIAVQNAVAYEDLGVATSGATLFRLIGGSFGTALLGTIFAARFSEHLRRLAPPGSAGPAASAFDPQTLLELPPPLRALYADAFSASLSVVFVVASVVVAAGFLIAWILPEHPLRETVAASAEDPGSGASRAFPMPGPSDPLPELVRSLARLADRDVRRQYIESITWRAGVDLSPAAAWLLLRLQDEPQLDLGRLALTYRIGSERLVSALQELWERGLVCEPREVEGRDRRELTEEGLRIYAELAEARRERLEELFAEWPLEHRGNLAAVLTRLARELVPETSERPLGGSAPTRRAA
ncbi:MAG: MFS transporter [Armatimonadota bacterium]